MTEARNANLPILDGGEAPKTPDCSQESCSALRGLPRASPRDGTERRRALCSPFCFRDRELGFHPASCCFMLRTGAWVRPPIAPPSFAFRLAPRPPI